MDDINNSIKQAKILKEDIERQRKANLYSIIKSYKPKNKFKALQSFINSIESPTKSYDYILNPQKDFNTELQETIDNLERMKNSVTLARPIDYINGFVPNKHQYTEIYESINKVNWIEVYQSLSESIINLRYPFINSLLKPDEFSKTLHVHVKEINDEELNEIFTIHFLKKITRDWWIFPRFCLVDYKEISKIKDINSYNNAVLNEFYFYPELIEDLISKWDIDNENRKTIIEQAYFNYKHGKFETCVILLMLQIEGIMKEKIDFDEKGSDLRKKIQKALNKNCDTEDPWEFFLNKANAEFILRIVKPLYDYVDFEYDMGDINRHEIAHVGVVEATQLGAMRLFLILDTVMYILEDIDKI